MLPVILAATDILTATDTSYKWHPGEGKWIYCSRMLGVLGVPNTSVPPTWSTAEDVDGPVVLPQPSRAHEAGAQGSYGPEVAVARNIPLLPISSYHIMFVCQFTTVECPLTSLAE